jgi:hypothetical protein
MTGVAKHGSFGTPKNNTLRAHPDFQHVKYNRSAAATGVQPKHTANRGTREAVRRSEILKT